jgi:hypothetical protein
LVNCVNYAASVPIHRNRSAKRRNALTEGAETRAAEVSTPVGPNSTTGRVKKK